MKVRRSANRSAALVERGDRARLRRAIETAERAETAVCETQRLLRRAYATLDASYRRTRRFRYGVDGNRRAGRVTPRVAYPIAT